MVRGSIPRRPTEFSLPISDRCSQVRESGDVVATKVERHRADVREVEANSALAEPGRDDIDESNIGKRELGEQTTRKRRAAGVDDKEPTTRYNERAIVTVRSVNTLAYLACWTLRSLRGGGERKNGNRDLPGPSRSLTVSRICARCLAYCACEAMTPVGRPPDCARRYKAGCRSS